MKKRIISVLLALTVIFTSTITVFADEVVTAPDTYYELDLPFTYAKTGLKNELPATFMIPGDSSTVYIKAEDIELFLELNYFEYEYAQTNTQFAITNKYFCYAIIYEFNTNRVLVYAGGSLLEYEAPAPSLFKDGVAWLPFEFTFRLFNISYCTNEQDQIVIEAPVISQLMALSSLSMIDNYAFDWISELGYSESQRLFQHERAKNITRVAGILKNDGNHWNSMLSLSNTPADNGYARKLAALFTSPSATEIDYISNSIPYVVCDTIVDSSSNISENLSYDGLNKTLKNISKSKFFKNNKKLKSFITSLNKNKKEATSLITSIKKNVKVVSEITDYILPVLDYISYYVAIYNKSQFASESLETYSNSCSFPTDRALHEFAIAEYDKVGDALAIYLKDHFTEFITGALRSRVPIVSLITFPAELVWSFCSKNIAESYVLSEHAICYQNDAREHMKEYINAVFGEDGIRKDKIETASHFAYAYLKFSSIAREYASSAVNSAPKIDKTAKKKMMDYMSEKNRKISQLLIALEVGVDGYFPDEVGKSEKDWNTDAIIQILKQQGTKLDSVTQDIPIKYEFNPIPGDGTITANDAVSIVVEIMGGKSSMLLADYILQNFVDEESAYNFVASEEPLYIEEITTFAYLVRMGIDQNYDQNCVFVPVDGSAAWLGIDNGDGTYYCYLSVDLKNFSLTELIVAMEGIYVSGEVNGLVLVEDTQNT